MNITGPSSINRLMSLLGFSPVVAAVVSILLREGRPLTLSELAEKTGYAKSHLSYAIRVLEEKLLVELKRGKRRIVLVSLKPEGIEKIIREHIREIRENLKPLLEFSSTDLSRRLDSLIKELDRVVEER